MKPIKLQAATGGQPGYGELVVSGWSHGAEACELCVQRNQDNYYLGENNDWGARQVWHQLGALQEDGERFLCNVDHRLVDPLVENQRMYQFRLTLRDAQSKKEEEAGLRIDSRLQPSTASGSSRFEEKKVDHTTRAAPKDEPVPEPPMTAPEQEPIQAPEPIVTTLPPVLPKKSSKIPLILIILLLVLALAAAAWWFLLRKPPSDDTTTEPSPPPAVAEPSSPPAVAEPSPPPATAEPSAAPAAGMAVCSPETLADAKDDLSFIQACLKSNPSSEQVLAIITAAKEAGRCNVMQRLYAHKAQSGDAAVAYAYAREYDPAHYAGGGCIKAADGETAVYWYEIVVEHDPQNQDAQQRLKELGK